MHITGKHKIRKELANLPIYHATKGDMLKAIESVLEDNGLEAFIPEIAGDSGHVICPLFAATDAGIVCDCCKDRSRDEFDNGLFLAWYRMPSDRIELTCYIS